MRICRALQTWLAVDTPLSVRLRSFLWFLLLLPEDCCSCFFSFPAEAHIRSFYRFHCVRYLRCAPSDAASAGTQLAHA